jgi:hypothetical protein
VPVPKTSLTCAPISIVHKLRFHRHPVPRATRGNDGGGSAIPKHQVHILEMYIKHRLETRTSEPETDLSHSLSLLLTSLNQKLEPRKEGSYSLAGDLYMCRCPRPLLRNIDALDPNNYYIYSVQKGIKTQNKQNRRQRDSNTRH